VEISESDSDSSLFKYATSSSELATVMQVVVKTSEFCRCQKFSVICGGVKVAVHATKSYEGIEVCLHCFLMSLGGESAIVFKLQPPYREKCTR